LTNPRTNPSPPYRGPERSLAPDETELSGFVRSCKEGRLYDAEAWIASGRPLQVAPDKRRPNARLATPLSVCIDAGNFDLARLLLCNGYRMELEPRSPLNGALESRRWDLVDLLLEWGADPAAADIWRILDTYQRVIFDRFWAAGVDLARDGAMADALSSSTRNRPLYGFAKAYRDRDPRIQRALDAALGTAVEKHNDKAISLCLWAGADPRHRVGEIGEDIENDEHGMTAFERSVIRDTPEYLRKLGFDPVNDDLEGLFAGARGLDTLRALVAIRQPADWTKITEHFISSLAFSVRFSIRVTSFYELDGVFALGGRLGPMHRSLKADLRYLLLSLDDRDSKRLFSLLRNPERMDKEAFLNLIGHEKLAARYMTWPWQCGVDRALLVELAETQTVPAPVRRMAKARITPVRRIASSTWLREGDQERALSREELYELVWSEPVLKLSRRFGLSDNGLRKRCKAMNVPTPSPGYWQRVANGRRGKRAPLPPLPE
jgi:hypothetical protein